MESYWIALIVYGVIGLAIFALLFFVNYKEGERFSLGFFLLFFVATLILWPIPTYFNLEEWWEQRKFSSTRRRRMKDLPEFFKK